jgi:hypothetical protein
MHPSDQGEKLHVDSRSESLSQGNLINLILQINNKDQDRVQITILLLVFLVEFEELKEEFFQSNVFEMLLKHMKVNTINIIGLRIAVAFILRELYKNHKIYVEAFISNDDCIKCLKDFLGQET